MSNLGPLLIVPALWLLDAIIAWVGVVRHLYRGHLAQQDLDRMVRCQENGLLKWAAAHNLAGESARTALKAGLCLFCVVRLDITAERLDLIGQAWDERDVLLPLIMLAVLVILTVWSNWEQHHRPVVHEARAEEKDHG